MLVRFVEPADSRVDAQERLDGAGRSGRRRDGCRCREKLPAIEGHGGVIYWHDDDKLETIHAAEGAKSRVVARSGPMIAFVANSARIGRRQSENLRISNEPSLDGLTTLSPEAATELARHASAFQEIDYVAGGFRH